MANDVVTAVNELTRPKVAEVSSLIRDALDVLGQAQSAKFKPGVVSALGFAYWDGNKQKTMWATEYVPMKQVVDNLLQQGHGDLSPAFKADVDGYDSPVFLSTYHTKRVFHSAPLVKLGDMVEVFVVRNSKAPSGVSFAYQPLKRTK